MFAKKSLGQNFLRSKTALAKIIGAGDLKPDDVVLEVGPGDGVLTLELLARAGKVTSVEKDNRLIPVLRQKFSAEISSGKLDLIHGDILDFSPSSHNLKAASYKLIANIPYYITGQLIRKFLESEHQPSRMVLLLQKEVAERVVARDGKESLLSLSVKAYGTARIIAPVPAGSFVPAPKVDSAILAITDISKKFFGPVSEEKFFGILKTGFAHKRKKLAGNLKNSYSYIENTLKNLGIEQNARPENLSLSDWRNLVIEATKYQILNKL